MSATPDEPPTEELLIRVSVLPPVVALRERASGLEVDDGDESIEHLSPFVVMLVHRLANGVVAPAALMEIPPAGPGRAVEIQVPET